MGFLSYFMTSSSHPPSTDEEMAQKRIHEQVHNRMKHQYDGKRGLGGYFNGYPYRRPKANDESIDLRIRELGRAEEGVTPKLDALFLPPSESEPITKALDLDTYYSATRERPRRLLVQVAPGALKKGESPDRPRHWRYRSVKGNVPLVIKLAELCNNPLGETVRTEDRPFWRRIIQWILIPLVTAVIGLVIQILLSVELFLSPWSDDGDASSRQYDDYDNSLRKWPKHAINPLDQRPGRKSHEFEAALLRIPRRLVWNDPDTQEWTVTDAKEIWKRSNGNMPRYIFMSYCGESFPRDEQTKTFLERAAKAMIKIENEGLPVGERKVDAFWLDKTCIAEEPEERTKDVNSICDAVRAAQRVYIVLPEHSQHHKQLWGSRVWTLPEALLAANKLRVCTPVNSDISVESEVVCVDRNLSLTDMYQTFWRREETKVYPWASETWAGATTDKEMGLLVEHFSGTLKLSDLQLLAYAVQALARREHSLRNGRGKQVPGWTQTDMAYAAMGLLSYRITPEESETNFQAIARLSLANDSDQLLERMVCLLPKPDSTSGQPSAQVLAGTVASSEEILRDIADKDQFDSRLWDMTPLCKMVGVDDDAHIPTVVLDQCRATPIRWKEFPAMKYSSGLKSFTGYLSIWLVKNGCYWVNLGFATLWTSIPLAMAIYVRQNSPSDKPTSVDAINLDWYYVGMALYFSMAWLISFFAPCAIDRISHDSPPGPISRLVGFEGTMEIRDLERLIFGNFHDRLSYTPSSTPLSRDFRDETYREAKDLNLSVLESELLPGQRLFTIVDLGDYSVSIIAAERPPTVALICGRDGGMLRVLLCSWRFENNCLYRETVMRMRSSIYDQTTPQDWVKVSLATQGEVARAAGVRWY